jgi:hypothetical protein
MQGNMNGTGMGGGMQGNMNGTGMGGGMQGSMNGMGMGGAMQGGMNGTGMSGGMQGGKNGTGMSGGMQGGMNGMGTGGGMQEGMNGTGMGGGMQGGMNGMGMGGGMQGGMNGMGMGGGMQGGMNGMGMGGMGMEGCLSFRPVGGFKDMNSQIFDVPEGAVKDVNDAGNRLFALKSKLNELQAKYESYKTRQMANGGVAAASALFTFGTSLLVQGPAAVHQHSRMQAIKRAMGPCIEQINMLRECFGNDPSWQEREATVQISQTVFGGGVDRNSLKGGL